jgi:hypothetical protein
MYLHDNSHEPVESKGAVWKNSQKKVLNKSNGLKREYLGKATALILLLWPVRGNQKARSALFDHQFFARLNQIITKAIPATYIAG